MPKKHAPSPASTAVSSISSDAIPVSMSQYGAGHRHPTVGEALVGLGVPVEVGVLVRVRDDQQRGVHLGGEPALRVGLRADRVAEPGNVGGRVQDQEAPALGEPADGARRALWTIRSTASGGTGRLVS